MTSITPHQLQFLLPLACQWAENQEKRILADGRALNPSQLADARKAGVRHPEKIRLLAVTIIPSPTEPILRAAAEAQQFITPETRGLTLRYGIFIRSDVLNERSLIFHELVHTAQYERLGGFFPFLKQYLHECITVGYPAAPLEQEAIRITGEQCP